jgi:CRISPR-associated protein Cmr1
VADLTIRLKTLTPLWTGGVDQQCDRLHETGLLGSLRWWYEALVRGLGGSACDPTDNSPCRDDGHCAACELFGCTGWSRKFRLRVTDSAGKLLTEPLKQGTDFNLHFIPLRNLRGEEEWLLVKAVGIIAQYGSLGGRTTGKPQAKKGVGEDYGLVLLKRAPLIECNRDSAKGYLSGFRSVKGATGYPELRCFFFVQGSFLWREQMNALIKREPFLRGDRGGGDLPAVGKKVFSFRTNLGRVWGYARDAKMRDEIIKHLRSELGAKAKIKTGEEVISGL